MNSKELLLSPIKIGEKDCDNRLFAQAMECSDADPDGNPSDLTLNMKIFRDVRARLGAVEERHT